MTEEQPPDELAGVKQERFKRLAPISEEDGIQLTPVSNTVGGQVEAKPVPKSLKYLVRKSAPSPRGWYKPKHTHKKIRPRPCYTEALLTTPYSGYCNVGCAFCYVNRGTRGYKSTLLPTVNEDYPAQMDMQLSKMWVTGAAYMSSYTEPFQHLEDTFHTTERLTKVFNNHNVPIFYLSRKIPPEWVPEALLANPYSYMQWSINTSNEADLRRLSPGIFKVDDLLREVERYSKLGIYTSFQINPILPRITTLPEIQDLITMLAEAGAKHVILKFAEESPPNRRILLEQLRQSGVNGVDDFERIFDTTIGHQYYIQQDLRINWLKEVLSQTRTLGITMSTCYEYWDNGKGGANLAPWFTTSDQCHGPAVPIHYREAEGEPFQALPGCYRKGCLYCEEFGTYACENPKLKEASALTYKDYREIRLKGDPLKWLISESSPPPEDAHERGKNPENLLTSRLVTDAEIWGLPALNDVLRDPKLAVEAMGCGMGCQCG